MVKNGLIWDFMAIYGEYGYFILQSSDIMVTISDFHFILPIRINFMLV